MSETAFSRDAFAAALHTKFGLRQDVAEPIELELVHVSELHSAARQETFSILFRGPLRAPLSQRIYQLEHEQLGTLALFIVPVSRDEHGYSYEAVFNHFKG